MNCLGRQRLTDRTCFPKEKPGKSQIKIVKTEPSLMCSIMTSIRQMIQKMDKETDYHCHLRSTAESQLRYLSVRPSQRKY